jgi:stage II sporulation protein D
MIVGKELEIRRWLSRSHLYSSAFIVKTECNAHGEMERFIFYGAGWGHGVGLCQIGAAVMATKGFIAEDILRHYFPGTQIRNIY